MGCDCGSSKNGGSRPNPGTGTGGSVYSTYTCDSFLPVYNGESYISIRDRTGIVRHKIYNNTLAVRYTSGNVLFLKTVSDNKIIGLSFKNPEDAECALIKLSDTYNSIRENYNLSKI